MSPIKQSRLLVMNRLLPTDSESLRLGQPEVHAHASKHLDGMPSGSARLVNAVHAIRVMVG
jgi:hypothetical protein